MLAQARTRTGMSVATAIGWCALALALAPAAPAASPEPGEPTLMLNAKTAFDPYVAEAAPQTQEFARERYWRTRAYPPFFDKALHWAPPTSFYKDLYAIYNPSETELVESHPDWVLRDASGRPLFIQYDCAQGSCPQYAADIGNPAWRSHWIAEVAGELRKGYIGVHIDDVNMEMKVSDGSGEFTRPIDPRTGAPMTDDAWQRYIAEFTEQIRAALPGAWISQNPLWWMDHGDPEVRRQIEAADAIQLERSFSDAGLTNGGGTFGFMTFIRHIDWLHERGKSIILSSYELGSEAGREFELAAYFLVQRGEDALVVDEHSDAYPDSWWPGWETDLGAPRGAYRSRGGLLVRRFADGLVAVNQPGARAKRLKLRRRYTRLSGARTRSVKLGEREGVVLLRTGSNGAKR